MLYENISSSPIYSSSGKLRNPVHFAERSCNNKTCYSFKSHGYFRNISISEEHQLLVIDGDIWRKRKKVEYGKKHRTKVGIIPNGVKKTKLPEKYILRKEAKDIKENDYLLTPVIENGKTKIDNNKAWLLGILAGDGHFDHNRNGIGFTFNKKEQSIITNVEYLLSKESYGVCLDKRTHSATDQAIRIRLSHQKNTYNFFKEYLIGKLNSKQFTKKVFELDKISKLNILGGFIDADGHFNSRMKHVAINCASPLLSDQLYLMFLSCNISCSLIKLKYGKSHYKTLNTHYYRITIPSSELHKIKSYLRSDKIPNIKLKPKKELKFFFKEDNITYFAQSICEIKKFNYTGVGYDLQIDPERAFIASGIAASNCRFFYSTEPKVAAGIDFYSNFSMSGFTLDCKSRKVRVYYEELCDKLKLNSWTKLISHEYFLLGDVYPFLEIRCQQCRGSDFLPSGKRCNHPNGTFASLILLNPDNVEVEDGPHPDERQIYMLPDDGLKRTIATGEPKKVFDRIPNQLKSLIASGHPIPLSKTSVSHLKHKAEGYSKYGTSMVRRLFTILHYKTKLMTANWIVADRLILPVRVVKVGDKERPAGPDDIADVQSQIAAVAGDPNYTIVTHHAFEMDFVGGTGKIHNISAEMEIINKEILDGLMLNQALLNGEAGSYSAAQVGVETLIKRLESWQNELGEWIEKHIFLPEAQMQGFIDEEKTKDLGRNVYLYPKIKWNDLQLRDKTSKLQMYMQLHDKNIISTETLLQEFDIDYDQELLKIRTQQAMSAPGGAMGGPGGAAGGAGGGMPMMGGGGMGGPDLGGGMPGGDMAGGGMPGGDMGGGMPGGGGGDMGGMAGPTGGAGPMGTSASGGLRVFKKGKEPKKQEVRFAPPKFARLTKIEKKLFGALEDLMLPYKVYGQYEKHIQGQRQPYLMDFAIPDLAIDIEADGPFHVPEQDLERDKKLANLGWRVIRFNEDAINEQLDLVKKTLYNNIKEASQEKNALYQRKKANNEEIIKTGNNIEENNDSNPV